MSDRGFTLIELLVSCLLLLLVTAAVASMALPARAAFDRTLHATESSSGARGALERIVSEVREAGGSGALGGVHLADVVPVLFSHAAFDVPAVSSPGQALTLITSDVGQGVLRTDVAAGAATLPLDPVVRCPRVGVACGFAPGGRGVVFDTARAAPFTVAAVAAGPFVHTVQGLPVAFPAGSMVVAIAPVTYGVRSNPNGSMRLVRRSAGGAEQPMLSNVVHFEVVMYGSAEPPRAGPDPPRATYGPRPPDAGQDDPRDAWPSGENCTTARDAALLPVSRLAQLGPSDRAALTTAVTVDGPWCPDALDAGRFDADLLRARSVELRLRVETASPALRGPMPYLFRRPGTQPDAARWVPDVEMRATAGVRNAPG